MSQQSQIQQAHSRVIAISFREDASKIGSGTRLTIEFLRRMAVWAECLGRRPGSFSVGRCLDETLELDPQLLHATRQHLERAGVNPYTREISLWYLEWCQAADQGLTDCCPCPSPYEPAIRMYERGQSFRLRKGFIEVTAGSAEPVVFWPHVEDILNSGEILDFSDAALDLFDKEWMEDR